MNQRETLIAAAYFANGWTAALKTGNDTTHPAKAELNALTTIQVILNSHTP